ncbi:MAG: NAD+ synthase [Candidatus Methylacidiphilales bacterium]|nr:NAD+ synthase [Candidatus Methylacidiphilales bacterium]
MKIACLQINSIVGAFASNANKLVEGYEHAVARGAELVLAPELILSGYPPRDLLFYPDLLAAQDEVLPRVLAAVGKVPLVFGLLERNRRRPGKPLHNSAAVVREGAILRTIAKTLLPTYDVFDEDRYFQRARKDSNTPVVVGDLRLGVTICEDIWNDEDFWNERLYRRDPVKDLVQHGVDLIVNISASPWHLGKERLRAAMLARVAATEKVPVVQVNMVGGNDELIFDGRSMGFDAQGRVLAKGVAFDEDMVWVDTSENGQPLELMKWPNEEEELFHALALGLRDYVFKCGFKQVVLGLSGGIDSALTAVIAAEALGPKNVLGVLMPSRYSSPGSIEDSLALAKSLEIEHQTVSIDHAFTEMLNATSPLFEGREPDITEENLQARLRGMILMAVSNKTGRLVLTTGNKSELAVGYCTLYGDMCGGLAVINDLPKTWVYRVARWLNRRQEIIPWATIEKAPSAELRPGQTDQDSLPPYEELDAIIDAYIVRHLDVAGIVAEGHDPALVRELVRKIDVNEHKRRQAAPGLKVTSKAFGLGRRMPIAQQFRHF